MANILILGGNGFIGSNLAEFFVNNGENVIVFDRKISDYQNLYYISNRIKIIKGNFNNSETIEKVFDKNQINIVIHLISNIIPGTPFNIAINTTELISTMKLIDIMRRKGVNKLIFFSSGGAVYGINEKNINRENDQTKPISFYGRLKLSIEKYIQMCHNTDKLNYIILRPSNAYGKNQNIYGNQGIIAVTFGNLIQNKKIEIWGNGEIIRDYIYIDDLCRALLLLIKNQKWNDIYNVGSGKGTSINKVLEIIKKITNINFNIHYKEGRNIDMPVNILDVSKLKNNINWGHLTDLEQGIEIMWEGLKNRI